MKRTLPFLVLLLLSALGLQLTGILRFFGRPRIVDNLALTSPASLEAINADGGIITSKGTFFLPNVLLLGPLDPVLVMQATHGLGGLVEIEEGPSRRFYVQQAKRYGFCGNYRGDWFPELTRPPLNRYEKVDLEEYLIRHHQALPKPELVGREDARAKGLVAAFVEVAEFYRTRLSGPHEAEASALAEGLVLETKGRDHYNVLWFYGSLFPERLVALAREKIKEAPRDDAYHYLKYIEHHAPTEYLDSVFAVQQKLGHNYEQDHIYYTNILLKAGDWRGFDYVMKAMDFTGSGYFGNGFRSSGGPAWPVAQVALAERTEPFSDMNLVNAYISRWYFANRDRVSFNGGSVEVRSRK